MGGLRYNSWTTYVLVVNLPDSTSKYNKKYFRKALAYSIDREKLFNKLTSLLDDYPIDSHGNYLIGPGIYGIVPPAFPEYDIKTIKGYSLNSESATYYLKKSKYRTKGVNSKLIICTDSHSTGMDYIPTNEISLDWIKYLGLPFTNTNVVTRATRNKQAFSEEEGVYLIPITKNKLPEEYLALFYSKNNVPNAYTNNKQIAYKSSVFDSCYEAGLNDLNRVDAIMNFKAAEQVLIDDAVVIPLFYSKFIY